MKFQTNLLRMRTVYDKPVRYYLQKDDKEEILLNNSIGKQIKIKYLEKINCINCGASTNKSFHQGYCYSCFTSIPQTDAGIIHPEKDQSHLGISRDMEWAKENTLIDHFVYLAITGNIKVGVTRYNQVPTRWIDQGAISAIKIARTPNRYLAGLIEVELKSKVSDKTNWRNMLKSSSHQLDLKSEKKNIIPFISKELAKYITVDDFITEIIYPFKDSLSDYNQVNLDNSKEFFGKLIGIKGQYLILSNGGVLNVRKHNGYLVEIEID
jgi:hypothetical protein